MTRSDSILMYFAIATAALFFFGMGFIYGLRRGMDSAREAARKAKVGEYYIDRSQNKKFRFKEVTKP